MDPVFSKLVGMNIVVAERIQSYVSLFPPRIAFVKIKRASGKHETMDHREFKMRFDPSD
jgi:hypothetical protein